MGLIKAIVGAAGGALADSWREYFYCEALSTDVLAKKGQKRISSKRSSNTKGEENIISNGSIIAVNEGQCMIIVEQGKVVDFCAEAGEFVFDHSTEPSCFYGGFGTGLLDTFKTVGKRFTFGGDTGKDQRIYYFNTKEIVGNKYGTPSAVPFRVIDRNIGLDMDIAIRCHGEYSYKIVDPIIFYTNITGNIADDYNRENIDSQLKSELMTALQPTFAKISEMGIRYSALPGHTTEIADVLNEILTKKWRETRGIAVASFGVSSVKASEEDEERIKKLQQAAVFRSPDMAAAQMVSAQSEAMMAAAKNEGAGSVMAFAGMNMANQAGGNTAQNLFAMSQQQKADAPKPTEGGWKCACGKENSGKFCTECGAAKPASGEWKCDCGKMNEGKFCTECGARRPGEFVCDKCGWKPEAGSPVPKFCPECGDVFDENDKK